MDREQFLEQLAAPAGGKENIGLCDFRSGYLSVTVKDRSVIDLNAIRGLPGVADAELLRSRLRITPDQTIMEELQMAKKEDYGALAKQILSLVGGAENVSNATHCATRLRFNLKDESKADTDAIKGLAGVVGVAQANGQYQVIIGAEVTQVYEKLSGMLGTAPAAAAPAPKGKWYDRVIDTLTGIFTPILPPLTAAGMIKAVLAILVAFKLVSNTSSTYQVINFMGDATFYFLPILLANSAAKKLGCNPYLAMMLGGILIHPSFVNLVAASKESGEAITIFMLPIYNASYSSSVIPIILGVLLMSKVEPWATRISPKAIRFFTAPLLTMFICGIATLCVLGPVGYVVSNALAAVINGLSTLAPWLVPTIVGVFLPFLVMTGTHHALTPIGINNRMTIGFDTIIYPGQLASNVAQGAAALAVSIKTKDPELKQLTSATGITAVCGIVSPRSVALVGFLMFGNLIRVCGVLDSLSETAQKTLSNLITLFLGLTIAVRMQAEYFLTKQTLLIMALGLVAFIFDTAGGVLVAKLINLFLPKEKKLNPMIGACGISAFPMSARVVYKMAIKEDPQNYLLMQCVGVNVSGQVASVIAGGLLLNLLV